jgi:hypothetical protein
MMAAFSPGLGTRLQGQTPVGPLSDRDPVLAGQPALFFKMATPSTPALRRANPRPSGDRLGRLARNEAKVFAELVWRGSMTVEEALKALSIPPYDRTLLEDFAAQHKSVAARDIRKVIQLRDLAVGEFIALVFSEPCQR